MENLKEGNLVLLSKNLSNSIKEYGGASAKIEMQGTYQEVGQVFSDVISVKVKSGINIGTWTILKSDVVYPPFEPVKIKPEFFDPNQLVID
jgi:hypothetical protein